MDELADILPHAAAFVAAGDTEAFFAGVPGKWCVALLRDAVGQPLQLVCAKNLRAMIRRRLEAPDETDAAAAPTKRVDYRTLVGSIAWRRVDSEFEMDLVYIEAARVAFPTHWRRLIPDRSSHFVNIDLDHPHPDFVRTSTVPPRGQTFGPFPDKAKTDRWIEFARDAFDLCRYRNILAQAPAGRACAYKQMAKCPAPCDGTIALHQYRSGVASAVEAIRSPQALATALADEMRKHAAQQAFERAGKVKTRLATFEQLQNAPYRAVRPIEAFRYVAIQPGPRRGTAKIFNITADAVGEVMAVIDASVPFAEVCRVIDSSVPLASPWPAEVLLGTVCFHLASPKSGHRIVARGDLDADKFEALVAEAAKPRAADATAEPVRETRLQLG